jgi:hypothetical protein
MGERERQDENNRLHEAVGKDVGPLGSVNDFPWEESSSSFLRAFWGWAPAALVSLSRRPVLLLRAEGPRQSLAL